MAKRGDVPRQEQPSSSPSSPEKPFEKRKQYSIWLLPSVYKQIQHEAIDRELSVGEVVEEALGGRVQIIRR